MKKILYVAIVLVSIAILLSAFFVLNGTTKTMSEAEKRVALAKMLGRKPNLDVKNAPIGNVAYKGKYASFMYPAVAKIYTYKEAGELASKTEIESFSFDIANPRLIFYFLVSNYANNVATLDDIPAVRLREDKTRGYQQSEILIDGQKGLIFTRLGDQSEKSGYFIVNNLVYSVSVTSNDVKEAVNLFDNVIKTLKFVK